MLFCVEQTFFCVTTFASGNFLKQRNCFLRLRGVRRVAEGFLFCFCSPIVILIDVVRRCLGRELEHNGFSSSSGLVALFVFFGG